MLTLRRETRLQFPLQDILAVMVGYGMAALLFRACWPASRPSPAVGVPAIGLYLWLGMAMSGPILLLRRRSSQGPLDPQASPGPASAATHTWAERAWLFIGTYWIIIGMFVIPARMHSFRLTDVFFFVLVPILVVPSLRILGAGTRGERRGKLAWTHLAAVILVSTWPIAWVCLIVLGRLIG